MQTVKVDCWYDRITIIIKHQLFDICVDQRVYIDGIISQTHSNLNNTAKKKNDKLSGKTE